MTRRSQNKSAALDPRRWLAYTAAALATGAGSVATSEAEIHYSGAINYRLDHDGFRSVKNFPLIHGAHFKIVRGSSLDGQYDKFGLAQVKSGASVLGTSYFATKLYVGANVSAGHFEPVDPRLLALVSVSGSGNFADLGVGYVGFKFDVGNGPQYGWMRIRTYENTGSNNKLVILGYAYADPGEPIRAGQTTSSARGAAAPAAATSKGSLGLLALGSVGLLAWRKSRKPA